MLDEFQWPGLQERRQQASLTFFYKIHNNLVTIDKNRYLSEEYQIPPLSVSPSEYTAWNFLSSPGQLQLGMDFQPKLSADGFKSKI